MKIAVPKEIKNNENRVGLTPASVKTLCDDGHEVYVQSTAGHGIGITDEDFKEAGAKIVPTIEEAYDVADMIIKVKEPQPLELKLLKPKHLLYTYLHLAADKELTLGLLESGCTSVAYETIQLDDGSLPLLVPMSEVAGRMATQVGATYLQKDRGGKGILLGGVPGVRRAKVTIIGCGIAGANAAKMAMGLGADVTCIDLSLKKLAEMDDLFENRITTLHSNPYNIEMAVTQSDLVIGAVLVAGARAPKLVTKDMLTKMEDGSVVVDIAVDQGGCIETCKPTTHADPTFVVEGVLHYCVANMPGAVPQTSTFALNNATLGHARKLASLGVKKAVMQDNALMKGLNTYQGKLVYEQVAKDLELPYTPLADIL